MSHEWAEVLWAFVSISGIVVGWLLFVAIAVKIGDIIRSL